MSGSFHITLVTAGATHAGVVKCFTGALSFSKDFSQCILVISDPFTAYSPQVGPYGDTIRYSYDEPLVLIPECDGVRLLSNSLMEILQRVPDSIVSIFGVGSTDPAALLFEAMEHFEKRRWGILS